MRNIYGYVATPGGTSSGTHAFALKWKSNGSTYRDVMRATALHGSAPAIRNCTLVGDSSEVPSGADEQYQLLFCGRIWASYDCPLKGGYYNDTDVNNANNGEFILLFQEIDGY